MSGYVTFTPIPAVLCSEYNAYLVTLLCTFAPGASGQVVAGVVVLSPGPLQLVLPIPCTMA